MNQQPGGGGGGMTGNRGNINLDNLDNNLNAAALTQQQQALKNLMAGNKGGFMRFLMNNYHSWSRETLWSGNGRLIKQLSRPWNGLVVAKWSLPDITH